MWTLEEAKLLVQSVGGTIFRAGYAPSIMGSVVYRGVSINDLDLLLVRRPQLLKTDYPLVDYRLKELGWEPACFGTRNLSVEDRVPDRLIYRYSKEHKKLEVTVLDLEHTTQNKPFFGARGREEAIQWELDSLEATSNGRRNAHQDS